MFVVIALGAEGEELDSRAMHAFGTPTLVHFGAVLLLACILSVPGHTTGSLGLCFLVCGLGGLTYAGWVITMAMLQKNYNPDFFDWLWYVVFPIIGYAALLVACALLRHHPETALYTVAASSLVLLYVGIHNAWDSATYMASRAAALRHSTHPAHGEPKEPANPPEE
jgi:cytochrome bd-type quinol oxidase subunit 2